MPMKQAPLPRTVLYGGIIGLILLVVAGSYVRNRQRLAGENVQERALQEKMFTYETPAPTRMPPTPLPVAFQGVGFLMQIPGAYELVSEAYDQTVWRNGINVLLLQSADVPFPSIKKEERVVLPLGSAEAPNEVTVEMKYAKSELVQGYGRSFSVYNFPCTEEFCFYDLATFEARGRYYRYIHYGSGPGLREAFLDSISSITLE